MVTTVYETANVLPLGQAVAMGDGTPLTHFGNGWSKSEPDFRWTDGMSADLIVGYRDAPYALDLVVRAAPYLAPPARWQRVMVYADGRLVHAQRLIGDTQFRFGIKDVAGSDGAVRVTFVMLDARFSGTDDSIADPRDLGLSFRSIMLVRADAATPDT